MRHTQTNRRRFVIGAGTVLFAGCTGIPVTADESTPTETTETTDPQDSQTATPVDDALEWIDEELVEKTDFKGRQTPEVTVTVEATTDLADIVLYIYWLDDEGNRLDETWKRTQALHKGERWKVTFSVGEYHDLNPEEVAAWEFYYEWREM